MDCWEMAGIRVEQGEDGLVVVERIIRWLFYSIGHYWPSMYFVPAVTHLYCHCRGETLVVRASPTNGRIKVMSEFMFATASRGNEEHAYIRWVAELSHGWSQFKLTRSGSRRIHYSGVDTSFTIRQGGKAGGFDSAGFVRIYWYLLYK